MSKLEKAFKISKNLQILSKKYKGIPLPVSVKEVNKYLKKAEADFSLVKGSGYFYFASSKGKESVINRAKETSVMVYSVTEMEIWEWLDAAQYILEDAIYQM